MRINIGKLSISADQLYTSGNLPKEVIAKDETLASNVQPAPNEISFMAGDNDTY